MTPTNDVDNPLTPIDMIDLSSGNTSFYVYGQVKYRDAFGGQRCTKFRLTFSGKVSMQLNPQRLGIANEGNEIDKNCPE
jgi:hypothetical protein